MIELILTEIGMLLAFVVGFILGKTGKVNNPVESLKLYKQKKKAEQKNKEQINDEEITLHNINNYNGTGAGQKKYN